MFTLETVDGGARAGVLQIGDRKALTPFFMPVSTKSTIKHFTFEQLKRIGTQAVIMNAFILSLRPGEDLVRSARGLHTFSTYDGIIATDSGGFQVLSDAFVDDKNDRGVYFKNPYNGQVQLFQPEDSVRVQHYLGSDVAMVLDDQPNFSEDVAVIQEALDRTLHWAKRCIDFHKSAEVKTNPHQLLFAIGQGGIFAHMRKQCAEQLITMDFDGYAVGGLAIGEPPAKMYEAIAAQTSVYPEHKPRYVMGLGSPLDILEAVERGADMFDSIFPTQNARRGTLFTFDGILRIGRKEYREDFSPLDASNPLLAGISKAYVHHLLRVEEGAGLQIATMQNLWFMFTFMGKIRNSIESGTFKQFKADMQRLLSS